MHSDIVLVVQGKGQKDQKNGCFQCPLKQPQECFQIVPQCEGILGLGGVGLLQQFFGAHFNGFAQRLALFKVGHPFFGDGHAFT